tara:strand:- start:139 stop:444 length:306 start_codon:yes stop_codon:yes gene_type:complete
MQILNGDTLQKMIAANEEITIIDVRTEEEVAEGKIDGATNINIFNPDFTDKIDEYDKSKTYVMICRSGARSSQACMQMMGLGFENLYNLEGGMMSWSGETV